MSKQLKQTLMMLAGLVAIRLVFGVIASWVALIGLILLQHTKKGREVWARIKHGYLVVKHLHVIPWFKQHKDHKFFVFFEKANWFKWYGKRVVYVKPKENLTATQEDVKVAIKNKDYTKALEIVNTMPVTPKTTALKQVIESKL